MSRSVSDLVASLSNSGSDVASILRDLQVMVGNLSEDEISRDVRATDVVPLFVYVNSGSAAHADTASPIIRKLWGAFGTETIVEASGTDLSELTSCTTSSGREVILTCLQDSVKTESGIECIVSAGIFDFILDSLRDDLCCTNWASKLLMTASLLKCGLKALFTTERVKRMSEIAACSDAVKYRVFDLCVGVATASDGGFDCCVKNDVFAALLADLDLDDVLLQLNCIELVGRLATSPKGLAYLTDTAVIIKLSNMLAQWPLNPLLSFVIPGIVRFFGNLLLSAPGSVQTICQEFPVFLSTVVTMLQDSDVSLVGIAVDTIGVLGYTHTGRLVLRSTPNNGDDLVKMMGRIMQFSESPIRSRCMEALCSLFKHIDSYPESSEITRLWFIALHDQPMRTIFSIASQPFEDLHTVGLKLLISVASNTWGLHQIHMCPGLLEYCLDRSTESTKAGRDLKYELVTTMVDTENALETLGMPVMLQLKRYVQDGPFYTTAQSTIAMESNY